MFQFTREFIINSTKGKLTAAAGITLPSGSAGKYAVSTADGVLYIDNLVNLRKKDILSVHKTLGAAGVKEKVVINCTGLYGDLEKVNSTDFHVRLIPAMGLEEKVSFEVNDAFLDHKKEYPFEVEGSTAQDLADGIERWVTRLHNMNSREMFSVEKSGTTITLTARDFYVRFKSLTVVDMNKEIGGKGSVVTGYKAYKEFDALKASYVTKTDGFVGRGTADYLVNNVRIPTIENINPYNASDTDERIVPDAIYDQYLVEIVTERRGVGGQVMGSIDHSLTSFVFFVRQDDCGTNPSDAFTNALTAIGCTPLEKATYVEATKQYDIANEEPGDHGTIGVPVVNVTTEAEGSEE